jgi:hypothetical protein
MVSAYEQLVHKLREGYNIHFDDHDESRWPVHLKKTFDNIALLGGTTYGNYNESITFETEERPWRTQTKRRAAMIAETATRCLRAKKNEAGWRLNLEHLILNRFSVEVRW